MSWEGEAARVAAAGFDPGLAFVLGLVAGVTLVLVAVVLNEARR